MCMQTCQHNHAHELIFMDLCSFNVICIDLHDCQCAYEILHTIVCVCVCVCVCM